MKSVRSKILFWSFATLAASLIAIFVISRALIFGPIGHSLFERIHAFEFGQATEIYQTGGPPALAVYLSKLHRYMLADHYLTDSKGRDLATGEHRQELLRAAGEPEQRPREWNGKMVMMRASPDMRYRFIVLAPPLIRPTFFLPFYLLVFFGVALLCLLLAANIASPLRDLAHVVDRLGKGDLSARLHSTRRDELGDLARSFDTMADRIQTLLTAERRLLQDVSHELRTPLARLSFAAELTRTAGDRDAAAARVRKEVQRLSDLVGMLLQITRAEGDPASQKHEPVSLDELVRDVSSDCQVEADARRCHIDLDIGARTQVRGDLELLRRAIENILRNAIRHAPEASSIDVKLDRCNGHATLAFRDFGDGVAEENLEKIFRPFFRADPSRDNATGGTGLGLSIAKRAVELHHGHIQARNAGPGLLICIELPVNGQGD